MRIWIDGYEANAQQRLGSSQVAFELLSNLEKIDLKNDYTVLLPAPPLSDLPREREGWKYKMLKPKKLWTRIALPLALFTAKQKPDIFFSPTHYIPRFIPRTVKKIVTIFDLSFLHFPEMFTKGDLWKLINWTRFSVQNADHIITISNFSKQDIMKQYKINKNKITVAYPGYDREKFTGDRRQVTDKKYIIYIGTIQPRKNLLRLIEAVSRIDNLNLMVVGKTTGEGKQGWMYEEILRAPSDFGIEDRVKFLGFVPTEELQTLLAGAIAYVQPSLWEGFGIPVVEAMAVGTPVIVSNVSSLPEVVGKAGLLIDPYSVDQIEQAIRLIVTDKRLQQKYSKAGLLQSQKFSWDKMAKEVLKVFEKLGS
ncbi:MAG: glycosyltransferase family 1 protein [Candidatus Daviesbacteria bacterium]|nr:glycosyltransferase family 1 protein [Candidatus Daviesbacteria bacterium]